MRCVLFLLLLQSAPVATADFVGDGVTTIDRGGTLNLGGSGITSGLVTNNGTIFGGRLVVDQGGFAKGTGNYSVNPLTINGGQYSPGNSPGRGTVGTFIADPGSLGGTYTFEINDGAPGLEGPTGSSNLRGWDLQLISTEFDLQATPSDPFTINLVTFLPPSPPDVVGAMDNFNPNVSTQWLAFAVDPSATSPFPSGFDPAAFNINTSAFVNSFSGSFGVARDGHNVFITYTAVPEPSAFLFGGLVSAVVAGGYWVRRKLLVG